MSFLPRRITLRARLTLIYGGLFLVAGVVLLGATYALFNQQLTHAPKVIARTATSAAPSTGGYQTFAFDAEGNLITGTDAQRWVTEQQARLHAAATSSLLTQGAIALAVVGAAAAGFGWLVAGRVLAPLHRVTDTARRIASTADRGLHERIQLHGPDDEVKDLAGAFNTMVERLDRSFDGQRRFVANASHELRTPLTLNRSLVEVAMHRTSASEDVKQLGRILLDINSRHDRLITGLLLLARSENEITEHRPVDLADLIEHVVAQLTPKAGLTIHTDPGQAPTSGDPLLLERLVHNLVDNAVQHNTGPGGWVRVASRTRDDSTVELTVTNTGPVIPPAEAPALFEPFHRHTTDRLATAKGAGLGLSIVRSVARAHGGQATAHPIEGGGLTVTVTLPARSDT